MLKKIRTFLTSRSTVILLILLLTASLFIASIVPQGGMSPSGGTITAPHFVRLFGLDRIFTTWWFVSVAALFFASLLFTAYDQYRITRQRISQVPVMNAEAGIPLAGLLEDFEERLRKEGYVKAMEGGRCTRYIKARAGYWGSFLLHVGMTITVLFSVIYVLTENRVVTRTVQGQKVDMERGSYVERRGLFSPDLPLPSAITLKDLYPEFWDNGELKSLSSDMIFHGHGGAAEEKVHVGINDKTSYHGLIVYQQRVFGHIFLVEFIGNGHAPVLMALPLPMPPMSGKASYGDFALDKSGYTLRAKYYYYAGTDGNDLQAGSPIIFLRLYDGEKLLGEVRLQGGDTGSLGPFRVRLATYAWWTDILFEGSRGMAGIFFGFFLLLCGGLMFYLVVPREVLVCKSDMGYNVKWQAARFPDFYLEEAGRIILTQEGRHD